MAKASVSKPSKNSKPASKPAASSVPAPLPDAYLLPQQMTTPDELFLSDLRDTYWAENHLVTVIPKMIEAAGDNKLKAALTDHLAVTETHVDRLEQVFGLIGQDPLPKKCDALEGLAISGDNIIQSTKKGTLVRDSGIIASGIKVENFEIVTYQGLIRLATQLGQDAAVDLLNATLQEEMEASALLTDLAEQGDDDN